MRLRLFLTIFIALGITAASISAIHFHFFKLERLRLIELNLQQNASLLQNSDLTLSKKEFSEEGAELIEKIIGDDKINMIIAIYNKKGKALYLNDNAYTFNLPNTISTNFKEWKDVETKDYFIKFLTVMDKNEERIISVGMILNQSLLRWRDLNQRILLFASIVLGTIILIAFFLTYILFRPLQILADQVSLMSERIEKGEFKDLRSWFVLINKHKKTKDEFQKLISSLDKLAKKITETQEGAKKWSALMAHELKTPMTTLRNAIDEIARVSQIGPKKIESLETELAKLEAIVTDFLEWASVENDNSRPEIHVIPLVKQTLLLAKTLEKNTPGTQIKVINMLEDEKKIFCNPLHFEQLINNLLSNAIKYGKHGSITLTLTPNLIKIQDQGQGIPASVLENFGNPFNRYKQGNIPGYGLGLAWVNTISKKYDWKIKFNNNKGTTVTIELPFLDT